MIYKKIISYAFLLTLFFAIAACSGNQSKDDKFKDSLKVENKKATQEKINKADSGKKESTITAKGKEYTAKFVCPDHCAGSGSDKPGECPKCGMEYIENPDIKSVKQ
jgi:hypothetical protein